MTGPIGRRTVARLAVRGVDVITVDHAPLPPETAKLVRQEIIVDLLDDTEVSRRLTPENMPVGFQNMAHAADQQ